MNLSEEDAASFEYSIRYERICAKDCLEFTQEGRNIGRLLLLNEGGLSINEIARRTGLTRPVVRRRIAKMGEVDASGKRGDKIVMTEKGRLLWLSIHREINKIAHGQQKGFSPTFIQLFRKFGVHSEKQLRLMAEISYPPLTMPK